MAELQTDTSADVHRRGYRNFTGGVGPLWDAIGELQFAFIRGQGLLPQHVFLDVACGGLRGGARFIRYLDADRYFGVDKHVELIIYGVAQELGIDTFAQKRPRFVITDRFATDQLSPPDYCLAQSLFTHLVEADIRLCLTNIRGIAAPGCRFFATFQESEAPVENPKLSHSNWQFAYSRAAMEQFGADAGWTPRYVGDWNHPRGQHMMEYIAES